MNKTKDELEQIAEQVLDAMLKVHRAWGPGLLESTYQACLARESTGTSLSSRAAPSGRSMGYQPVGRLS